MESDYYNLPEDVREYWIVNPMAQSVYVYYLDEEQFETTAYTFQDQIKTMIYEDFYQYKVLVKDRKKATRKYPEAIIEPATLEEIMLFYVKGELQ
jgi:hypothetical protein